MIKILNENQLRRIINEDINIMNPQNQSEQYDLMSLINSVNAKAESSKMKGAAARNNNPGNIKARNANSYYGQDALGSKNFAHFPNVVYGIREWFAYIERMRKTYNTIAKLWNLYAPASDGNNTSSYIANLSKQCGISPNAILPPVPQNQQLYWTLARACFQIECSYKPDDSIMSNAWNLYLQTQNQA